MHVHVIKPILAYWIKFEYAISHNLIKLDKHIHVIIFLEQVCNCNKPLLNEFGSVDKRE